MKKIILFFTMALMSAISASAQNVEIDGIYYDLDKNSKTATITNNGKKDADAGTEDGDRGRFCVIPEITVYSMHI